jgi:hypothetical protein
VRNRQRSSCSLSRAKDNKTETSDDEWDIASENQNLDFYRTKHGRTPEFIPFPSRSQHSSRSQNGISTITRRLEDKTQEPKRNGLMGLNEMYGGIFGNLVSLTAQTTGCDVLSLDPVQREIQIREKYWGDILERTVSFHNLQASMKTSFEADNVPLPRNNISSTIGGVEKKFSSSYPFLASNTET